MRLVVIGITVLVMISPGPDMVIVMRNMIIGGRAARLSTSSGVLTGNLVHINYCAVGRKTLERSQTAVSRVFGGLLILLGVRVAVMDH